MVLFPLSLSPFFRTLYLFRRTCVFAFRSTTLSLCDSGHYWCVIVWELNGKWLTIASGQLYLCTAHFICSYFSWLLMIGIVVVSIVSYFFIFDVYIHIPASVSIVPFWIQTATLSHAHKQKRIHAWTSIRRANKKKSPYYACCTQLHITYIKRWNFYWNLNVYT